MAWMILFLTTILYIDLNRILALSMSYPHHSYACCSALLESMSSSSTPWLIEQGREQMGEIVDLAEWKAAKEEAEEIALKEELDRLQEEVRELIADIDREGPHTGPMVYPDRDELLPQLTHIDSVIDGYWDAWLGLKEVVEGESETFGEFMESQDPDV